MRKRTLALLFFGTLFAALFGGVASVILIMLANPGSKGPHVSNDAVNAAFFFGAVAGVGAVIGGRLIWGRKRRPRKWESTDDGGPS